jgi:hypothetical protein
LTVAIVVNQVARLLRIAKRLHVWRANRSRHTRHVVNAASRLAKLAKTRQLRGAIQSKALRIVFRAIAIVIETITHLSAGQGLRETLRLVELTAFAREKAFLANTDTN